MRRVAITLSLALLGGCGSGIGVTLPADDSGAETSATDPGGETGDDTGDETGDDTGDETSATDPGGETGVDAGGETGDMDATGGGTDEPDVVDDEDAGPQTVEVFLQEQTGLSSDFVYKGVWAGEADRIVAVGNDGIIVEQTPDDDWVILNQGEGTELLNGIAGTSRDDLWAVGKNGALLRAGGAGFGDGGGCVEDADCDNSDPCTLDTCVSGGCEAEATGGPGCCGSEVGHWDFDGGDLDGWQVISAYGGITWQAHSYTDIFTGQPRWTSPEHALYFGDPSVVPPNFVGLGDLVGAVVISPPIALPASGSATLKFQVFMDGEQSMTFDVLVAQIESAGGLVSDIWTKALIPQIPTPGFFPAEANLSAWAGQTVRIRFAFDSIDNFINQGEGVFIDDIVIDTSCDGDVGGGATFPTLWGAHAIAEDDVYAVGLQGTILHFDGQSWKSDAGPSGGATWYGMHGGDGTIVLVGSGGAIQMSEGAGLIPVASPAATDLRDVHSADGQVFWVVGDTGTLIRGEGTSFQLVDAGTTSNLRAVYAAAVDEVYVVGDDSTFLFYDGATWTPIAVPEALGYHLLDVTRIEDVTVVTGEDGLTFYGDLVGGWTSLGPLTGGSDLMAAWGTGGEGFLVGQDSTVFRFTGVSAIPQVTPTTQHLRAVWGSAINDVWAIGLAGVVLHFDGATWTQWEELPALPSFESIWGSGSDDVYIAGTGGAILHWDGAAWTLVASKSDQNLRDVTGFTGGPVWAVGGFGTIMVKGPLGWAQDTVQPIVNGDGSEDPILDQLNAIWAASPTDAWAVGDAGRVLRWDGETWSDFDAGTHITLRGIYGRASDDIFACGSEGQILRFDGDEWQPMKSGSVATLYDVHGDGADHVVITGDIGTVLVLTKVDVPPAR